jgi:hypothetical protein
VTPLTCSARSPTRLVSPRGLRRPLQRDRTDRVVLRDGREIGARELLLVVADVIALSRRTARDTDGAIQGRPSLLTRAMCKLTLHSSNGAAVRCQAEYSLPPLPYRLRPVRW